MTEIAIREPAAPLAVANDVDSWVGVASQVIKLANEIADTPFVPDGLRGNVPAVSAAILAGRELGLPPLTSLANIHVIKGKPALSAVLMRALIQAQGHQWQDVEVSDTRVTVRAKRRGESEWTEASFSAAQAAKARIDLGGYAQDKLYARATSRLARRKFADVIAGMPYSAEELEDGDGPTELGSSDASSNGSAGSVGTKPTGRVTAAEITGRSAATETASPAATAPRAPETQPSPQAERAAGEAPTPPLPGEDEPDDTDYGTPGTVTAPQLTKLGATFTDLGFTSKEREQRLVAASQIVGRELETSSDLSRNEAHTLIDTLSRCDGSREKLIALLAAGEAPDAS